MRAMTYDRFGDDSVLSLTDQPTPKVGPGEVLIRVKAASVNPVDWKVMSGGLAPLMDVMFPVVPGWDVAGVVESVGIDTPEFKPGDEVFAYARKDYVHGGTFAELVSVPVRAVAHKPKELSWAEASAVPLTGLTAYQALVRLGVGANDTVLIHNAAGGVGTAAVQIAKALGATVIGTSSPKNFDYVLDLGADYAIAYGPTLVDEVRAIAPGGVSVSIDLVGGVEDQTLQVLAPGARHASIADPAVLEHGGQWMWVRPSSADLDALSDLVRAGKFKVDVAQEFPLEQLPDAFAASRDGHVRGKLVVNIG